VLILVPEIALTPLITRRFEARFPGKVAVIHSAINRSERYHEWLRIASGDTPVVIGARSALFAPLPNIGLVVVDEEHDGSYKQEEKPRYSGRDAALVRAKLEGCPVVLGSATPSLESYHNAETGRYRLLRMTKRPETRPMPVVEIIDLKKEQGSGFLSNRLLESLNAAFERGEQGILLINRRGYAHYLLCPDCGEVPFCPKCSVSLTYSKRSNMIRCHYCDLHRPAPNVCPKCGGLGLKPVGFGTERFEEMLGDIFPNRRIGRLDSDSTSRRGSLSKLLDDFSAGKMDLLVGTQIVAKGHDFPNVTVIGILLAETSLHFPDFRSSERTFQLLMQVAGRAGRADRPGKVVLQTFRPDHYAVTATLKHDYEGFYQTECEIRRAFGYPPFGRVALVRITGKDEGRAEGVAESVAQALRKLVAQGVHVLGPSPAPLKMVREEFRWNVMIKCPGHASLRLAAKTVYPFTVRAYNGCKVALDIDPQRWM
jgi:primosomal protein N' (replication factor Y)